MNVHSIAQTLGIDGLSVGVYVDTDCSYIAACCTYSQLSCIEALSDAAGNRLQRVLPAMGFYTAFGKWLGERDGQDAQLAFLEAYTGTGRVQSLSSAFITGNLPKKVWPVS